MRLQGLLTSCCLSLGWSLCKQLDASALPTVTSAAMLAAYLPGLVALTQVHFTICGGIENGDASLPDDKAPADPVLAALLAPLGQLPGLVSMKLMVAPFYSVMKQHATRCHQNGCVALGKALQCAPCLPSQLASLHGSCHSTLCWPLILEHCAASRRCKLSSRCPLRVVYLT